ncbi:hypothetical protein NST86_31155 [Bacillus sp. FSL L8-0199]|nr:hypothetical protein [Bacillus thuringiensis]MCU5528237.1 hypothetical protein [Bacillus cereus]
MLNGKCSKDFIMDEYLSGAGLDPSLIGPRYHQSHHLFYQQDQL